MIPSLLSLMEKQLKGVYLSPAEHELARLCWLGGAWALFKALAESKQKGNGLEVQKAYADELMKFVDEVKGN